MINHIPIYLRHTYDAIPRRDMGVEIPYDCNIPDRNLLIDWNGECFLCHCEAWLPVSVGNIDQFERLADIWENPQAQAIRQDVRDRKFTHCAVDRCGIMDGNIHWDRYNISINIDESCNLRCPSCRSDLIMKDSGPEYEQKLERARHIVDLLEGFDEPCHIIMSGNGDPLASAIMRPLIHEFQPKVTQTFRLFTNGLLLRKQLEKSRILPNITQYFISIDAGSAEVYHQVRQPGRWEVLLSNMEYLRGVAQQYRAEVLLKFVLQRDNWHDMENFVDLCQTLGFQGVINRLEDWGTWSTFTEQDVIGNHRHPLHEQAMIELKQVYSRYHDRIQFNSSLRSLALQ